MHIDTYVMENAALKRKQAVQQLFKQSCAQHNNRHIKLIKSYVRRCQKCMHAILAILI